MTESVTFGQILVALKQRGDVVQADQMLQDVTKMAIITAKRVGLHSIIPDQQRLEAELITTSKDDILKLIKIYKSQNKVSSGVQSVRSTTIEGRVNELRAKGFYVTMGVKY